MCPDRRVTAKARCRRGLLPVRPGGRAGPDFHPGISCRRALIWRRPDAAGIRRSVRRPGVARRSGHIR
nr:MAG TPA: hypothetical protein [Caudoviricetes sp.]